MSGTKVAYASVKFFFNDDWKEDTMGIDKQRKRNIIWYNLAEITRNR